MRRFFAVSWMLAVAAWPAVVHGDDRPTLTGYLEEVGARNPGLRASALRARSFGDEAIAASRWPDPTLSVMLDRVPRGDEMPMIRYQLSQTFPWPGKLGAVRLAIQRQGESAAADAAVRRLDVRAAAERAYLMLWMNAKRREVNRATRSLARVIADAAIGRYAAGGGGHHDVARAQVEIAELDVAHTNLEGERKSLVAMLNAYRDRPLDQAIADPSDVVLPSTAHRDKLVMRALRHRPELARMHAMHREAMAMAEVARKERYPELMGSLWANQMIGGPPTMGVMLGVTLPVFGASRAAHRATAFDLRAKGAREDAAAMASMIGFEVTDAVNKLATAEREIELIETMSLPKARESFEASLASYGAGGGHMLDVLDARRALQGSQLGLVEARLRRATAFAELERAVGARVEP